jgi:hypothetical protein
MLISEIYTNPSRDEFMHSYAHHFHLVHQTIPLSTGLSLKISQDQDECHLGVFDGVTLVSYVSLHKAAEYWQVDMQCTDLVHRGQGYIRKSIETAIRMYGCVISDVAQTPEAQCTWCALILRPNLYSYYHLNLDTHQKTPFTIQNGDIQPNPWDETDTKVILACDRVQTESAIKRMSERQQRDQQLGRRDRWLGPGFTEYNP